MAGIYVHIPFCHSKFAYCDFYSKVGVNQLDAYIDAVAKEYASRYFELGLHPITTLYFGGGTPSILSPEQFHRLAGIFKEISPDEFTIEVNPEDVDAERLAAWTGCGVNRISMGVQSLVDAELRAVGRRHSAEKAIEAIATMRQAGISNISCDLIYGLPGQTVDSWTYSIEKMLDIHPSHLSAYCLTVEPHTVLGVKMRKGEFVETDDDTIARFYEILCKKARASGYRHYEISNFAIPGMHSRHNRAYWDGTPYLGLGPGAHSLDADGLRRYVASDTKRYVANPAQCLHADSETETEKVNDIIFTALRTSDGLQLSRIPEKYRRALRANALPLLRNGQLIECHDGNTICIPEKSWLTSDAIIRELLI